MKRINQKMIKLGHELDIYLIIVIYGAIAQLGERLNGIQEVRGSIPRSSTNLYIKIPVMMLIKN